MKIQYLCNRCENDYTYDTENKICSSCMRDLENMYSALSKGQSKQTIANFYGISSTKYFKNSLQEHLDYYGKMRLHLYREYKKEDLDCIVSHLISMLENNTIRESNNNVLNSVGESFVDWLEGGNTLFDEGKVRKNQVEVRTDLMNLLSNKVDELTDLLLELYSNCSDIL